MLSYLGKALWLFETIHVTYNINIQLQSFISEFHSYAMPKFVDQLLVFDFHMLNLTI